MNVFTFSGRLGRDAEVRYTTNSTAICSFAVANDIGYGDNKKTQWIDCALFGKRAEGGLPQYLTLGTEVVVSGEVSLNTYEKRDGGMGASLRVRVQELTLVGGRQSGGNERDYEPRQGANRQPEPAGGDDFDDDIPFAPRHWMEG